jgi:hypothetical protein
MVLATATRPKALDVSLDGSMVFVASMSRVRHSEDDYATVAYSTSTGEELWASRYNDPADGWDGATALGVSGSTVFVTGGSDGDFATELAGSGDRPGRAWTRT